MCAGESSNRDWHALLFYPEPGCLEEPEHPGRLERLWLKGATDMPALIDAAVLSLFWLFALYWIAGLALAAARTVRKLLH